VRTLGLFGAILALATAAPGAGRGDDTSTRWRVLHYAGGTLLVGTPSWYSPQRHPALPLVISPHARGGDPSKNARRWGDLPGRRELIVIDPALEGRVLGESRAWGYPPAIAKLVRAPQIARRLLPWLRWDPDRVYAAGFSMGGQESLLALARRPDLFAAVSVADSVTDFLRRWYEFPRSPLARTEQPKATKELGGTPARVPWLYRRRSPVTFARTIAFSGVPVQLWWNPNEQVVINQGTTQSGGFSHLLLRLNPDAPVDPVVHRQPHGWVFRSGHSLEAIVDFLLAHRRERAPAAGFSYLSWLRSASVWGWSFRSGDVGHGFWRISAATPDGFRSSSPSWLTVTPPGASRPVRLAPGRHVVRLP
jgi:pimeloyl-ACP methyl ester carboxylesterase